jgi:hypothetical protein
VAAIRNKTMISTVAYIHSQPDGRPHYVDIDPFIAASFESAANSCQSTRAAHRNKGLNKKTISYRCTATIRVAQSDQT